MEDPAQFFLGGGIMRLHRLALAVVIGVAIAVSGILVAQEVKKDATPKFRGQLPQNWSKLGLTDVQKQQAYKIQTECDQKVEALTAQITALRATEKSDLAKVLTADQKKRLREILDEKIPGAGGSDEKKPVAK